MNNATSKPLLKAFLLLVLVLTACNVNPSEKTELEANQEKWQNANIKNYTLELRRGCFCPKEYVGPVSIVVKDGVISSMTYTETNEAVIEEAKDVFVDVDGLFALVEEATTKADELKTTWNDELGYPETISIDYLKETVDDEVNMTVLSFKQP